MNPFHLWLGLPEKSANPNHYQLLGITSSERDPKAIERAAVQRLARLKEISPTPSQVDAFQKMKQRIRTAQATLTDQAKRAEYDARLREKLAQMKRKKAASESRSTSEIDHQSSQSSTSIHVASESPASPMSGPVEAIPTAMSEQVAPNIPMAVPIQSGSPPPLAEVHLPSAEDVPVDFEMANASKASGELTISKRKVKRRKSPWMVPVFCLVLCLSGIFGLVYLVANYDSILGHRVTIVPIDEDSSPPAQVTKRSTINHVPGDKQIDPANYDPKVIPGKLSTNDLPANKPDEHAPLVNVKYEKLDIDALVQFRRHMEKARRAMYRRDPANAQNEIQNAQALFTRFGRGDIALEESQVPLRNMADAAATIQTLLDGFWRQVVSSAVALPAGQPIEVAGKTLGFVEGTPDFVILRIDGKNIKYDYEFLAPGIAMAVAEQGTKQDAPTFFLQQAAFYAIHSHIDPKYRDRAIEFAERAANDGHETQQIEDFVGCDINSVGVPAARIAQPPAAEMKEKIPKLMVRLGIADLRKMRPEQAAKAIDITLDTAVAEKDNLRQAMTFEIAYMLAVKASDIREVVDVLDEYHVWFDYNYTARVEQALLDVAKQPLDERKARYLLSAMIDAAQTSRDQQYKKKLIKAGQKVADQHDFSDLFARLESATK